MGWATVDRHATCVCGRPIVRVGGTPEWPVWVHEVGQDTCLDPEPVDDH